MARPVPTAGYAAITTHLSLPIPPRLTCRSRNPRRRHFTFRSRGDKAAAATRRNDVFFLILRCARYIVWVDSEMRGGRNSGVGIANARPASNYGSRQSRGQPNSRCSMPVLDSKGSLDVESQHSFARGWLCVSG